MSALMIVLTTSTMERFMPGRSIADAKQVSLAVALLVSFAGSALAQSADNRSTADIEKENAALRAKVHRLEAEKENVALRAKVDQLQGRRPVQAAAAESEPLPATRIQATSGDRTLMMADMPVKAAPIPPAYYSWTGFYLGGNIGYSVGSDRAQSNFAVPGSAIFDTSAGASVVTPAGGIGGVQIGYNWQGGPNWLAGFEADVQGSAQKATSCVLSCLTEPVVPITQTFTNTQNLDYFATFRGRFGFVDRGNLFYVTGGGAYGHVNQTLNSTITTAAGASITSASTVENKFGWVVGAGVESSLGGNWTAKVEYLYMDLGSITTAYNFVTPAGVVGAGPTPLSFGSTSTIRDNIIRAGLNYRFGPPAGPVSAYDAMAAVPPPIYSWTGFYVGANAGYGFGNDHNQLDEIAPPIAAFSAPGTSVTPKGGLGGAQFGYNWQAAPHWVAGFEADLQGTTQNDTVCSSITCFTQANPGGPQLQITTIQHQLDYFGTARGRIGYLYNNTLFYGTGGAAFGHVRESIHEAFAAGINSQIVDGATTKDLTGYVVGGGIEAMLTAGWSVKAEYLYMNLGSLSQTVDISTSTQSASLLSNSTIRDHIVRAGINYHIGPAPY